jgi:hypothetical protein
MNPFPIQICFNSVSNCLTEQLELNDIPPQRKSTLIKFTGEHNFVTSSSITTIGNKKWQTQTLDEYLPAHRLP